MAHWETEKILKIAEAETRLEFYKTFKTAHEGKHGIKICCMKVFRIIYLNCILPAILRDDPDINQVHLRRLEEYQIGETTKRREEVRAIENEMREIDERAEKIWSKK